MKLDPRIEKESLIYTPFSKAKINLHEKGYFADDMMSFSDLKECVYGELVDIDTNEDYPYMCKSDMIWHGFYIPESSLKSVENKTDKSLTLDEVNNMCEKCMKEISDIKTELNSVKSQLQLNVEWLNRISGVSK